MSEKKDRNVKVKAAVLIMVYVVIITIIVSLFNAFLYSPMRVVGDSMNPTFRNNDVLLIDKLSYEKGEPQRFDLIVFSYQYDIKTKYIKRVIGLPGETVEIRDNKILIDDEELVEYYGIYENDGEKQLENYGPYTLDYDEFFVLGDNRDHSVDSRSGDVGAVSRDIIIGRAAFRLWPFNDIGSLKYQ